MRDLEHVRRSSESSKAREVRLQAIRSHHQSTRACTIPILTPVTGEEQRRIEQLSKDLEKFRSEIIVSLSNSCFSCHRLTYPQGGSYVTYETVEDFGYVHVVSPYWVKGKYHLMHVLTTYKLLKSLLYYLC